MDCTAVRFRRYRCGWYTSNEFVNENAELRFETRTIEISKAIRARMAEYEQVLWGGIGLFRASR
jgi:hypothetical protein